MATTTKTAPMNGSPVEEAVVEPVETKKQKKHRKAKKKEKKGFFAILMSKIKRAAKAAWNAVTGAASAVAGFVKGAAVGTARGAARVLSFVSDGIHLANKGMYFLLLRTLNAVHTVALWAISFIQRAFTTVRLILDTPYLAFHGLAGATWQDWYDSWRKMPLPWGYKLQKVTVRARATSVSQSPIGEPVGSTA